MALAARLAPVSSVRAASLLPRLERVAGRIIYPQGSSKLNCAVAASAGGRSPETSSFTRPRQRSCLAPSSCRTRFTHSSVWHLGPARRGGPTPPAARHRRRRSRQRQLERGPRGYTSRWRHVHRRLPHRSRRLCEPGALAGQPDGRGPGRRLARGGGLLRALPPRGSPASLPYPVYRRLVCRRGAAAGVPAAARSAGGAGSAGEDAAAGFVAGRWGRKHRPWASQTRMLLHACPLAPSRWRPWCGPKGTTAAGTDPTAGMCSPAAPLCARTWAPRAAVPTVRSNQRSNALPVQIVAVPYATGFDQLRLADEVHFRYERCLKALGPQAIQLSRFGVGAGPRGCAGPRGRAALGAAAA